jgi:LemA protein
MKRKVLIGCGVTLAIILILLISIYTYGKNAYNSMVQMEETVKERWSQVENVYQRRMDLIPNLVETVKGYASHERETFEAVTEARAKAGGMFNISEQVLNDPAMLEKFQAAQSSLSGALQRLMVIQEQYPELKANQNFLSLQDQLEGTENRISTERRRFNEVAREYNIFIKQFPRMILANLFGFKEKAFFKAQEGAETAPKVEF